MSNARRWLLFVDLVKVLRRCPETREVVQWLHVNRSSAWRMIREYREHCARLV